MNTGSKYQQPMSFGAHLSIHKKQIVIKFGISILHRKSVALICEIFFLHFDLFNIVETGGRLSEIHLIKIVFYHLMEILKIT